MSETHPNAYKMEADEKRAQAAVLLAAAEKLDPTPVEEPAEETPAPKPKKAAAAPATAGEETPAEAPAPEKSVKK